MIIICPQCGFMRDVPPERLPSRSAFATCPHCKNRFRVSLDMPVPSGEDDPLPDSAIRPERQVASPPAPQPAPVATPSPTAPPAAKAHSPAPAGQEDSALLPSPQPVVPPKPAPAAPAQQSQPDAPEEDEGSPWDHAPHKVGFLEAFYQTCMQVMFAGSYFFSRLNPAASLMRSLSFFLVLSVAQVLIERLWAEVMIHFLQPSAASDPQLKQLLAMLSSDDGVFAALLVRTAFMTAELYLTALIFTVFFSFLTRSKGNFGLIFQVTAYAAAPSILCVVPIIGSGVGIVWSVACCVIGCRYALRLHWVQAFGVVLPLYVILLPLMFQLAVKMASFS